MSELLIDLIQILGLLNLRVKVGEILAILGYYCIFGRLPLITSFLGFLQLLKEFVKFLILIFVSSRYLIRSFLYFPRPLRRLALICAEVVDSICECHHCGKCHGVRIGGYDGI